MSLKWSAVLTAGLQGKSVWLTSVLVFTCYADSIELSLHRMKRSFIEGGN